MRAFLGKPVARRSTSAESAAPERERFASFAARHATVQPKLLVGTPGDAYEREADAVAARVMRAPDDRAQRACACAGACGGCGGDHAAEPRIQTMRADPGEATAAAAPPAVDHVLRQSGEPLDAVARSYMERRFGHSFAGVRVHADARAQDSARAIGARAYTVGSHIVLGGGRLDPNGADDRRLLAHELTHVVQQSGGRAPARVARAPKDEPAAQHGGEPAAPPASTPRPAGRCHTGCSQRLGRDTTCSRWGFFEGLAERGGGSTKWRSISCCNTWPLSVEKYAREELELSGAASCHAAHGRETATVTYAGKSVDVLCSDTIPPGSFGESSGARACTGKITAEVLELSPKAMLDLSGQLKNPLPVTVCYSGSRTEMCQHQGSLPMAPKIEQCLPKGCPVQEDAPTHADSGWPAR